MNDLPGKHRPIPNHKELDRPVNSGVIEYTLTPVEKALAKANALHLIPTAEDRGLKAPPVEPRPKKELKQPGPGKGRQIVQTHITKELLEKELATGKTNVQIAEDNNIATSTVSMHLKRHGLKSNKRKPRRWDVKGGVK